MLKADLENEKATIANYRRRVLQADAMHEFALSEVLREILKDEQDHLIELATALNIDPPDAGIAK
jgi:bacterioferritin